MVQDREYNQYFIVSLNGLLLLLLSCFSRVWLCDPTDGSPPGSAVLGILQARTLEWVAIAFSEGHSLGRTDCQGYWRMGMTESFCVCSGGYMTICIHQHLSCANCWCCIKFWAFRYLWRLIHLHSILRNIQLQFLFFFLFGPCQYFYLTQVQSGNFTSL